MLFPVKLEASTLREEALVSGSSRKQLLRSGTAIGALVREAQQAESKADFIHKLAIALKEANESDYWLELLHQSGYVDSKGFMSISADVEELLKLLTSIIKTTRNKP
jgi:four helix bundle protein